MPKDEWAKERRKDAIKRILAENRANGSWGNQKKKKNTKAATKRASRKRNKVKLLAKQPTNAWNPNTVIWFGPAKDKPIKDVPKSYLKSLANWQEPRSTRIKSLCKYLKYYLAAHAKPQPGPPSVESIG